MIIEIALGIVLAVLILYFFPEIVGLAFIALAACLVLAIGASILLWAFNAPTSFFPILGIAILIVAMAYIDAMRLRSKLERFAQKLPPSLKRWLPRHSGPMNWTLLLFSGFLAIILSLIVMLAAAWVLDVTNLMPLLPGWMWRSLFVILLPLLTWGIYKLPWQSTGRRKETHV